MFYHQDAYIKSNHHLRNLVINVDFREIDKTISLLDSFSNVDTIVIVFYNRTCFYSQINRYFSSGFDSELKLHYLLEESQGDKTVSLDHSEEKILRFDPNSNFIENEDPNLRSDCKKLKDYFTSRKDVKFIFGYRNASRYF